MKILYSPHNMKVSWCWWAISIGMTIVLRTHWTLFQDMNFSSCLLKNEIYEQAPQNVNYAEFSIPNCFSMSKHQGSYLVSQSRDGEVRQSDSTKADVLLSNLLRKIRIGFLEGTVSRCGEVLGPDDSRIFKRSQLSITDSGRYGLTHLVTYLNQSFSSRGISLQIFRWQNSQFDVTQLSSLDLLVLSSNQRIFSSTEADAVRKWVRSGGSILAINDNELNGHYDCVGYCARVAIDSDNSLLAQFGLEFIGGDNYGSMVFDQDWREPHYINALNVSKILLYQHPSPVRVTGSAKILLGLQQWDDYMSPSRPHPTCSGEHHSLLALIGYSEYFQGRVLAVGDRNLFFNGDPCCSTMLFDSRTDHPELVLRMFQWLVRVQN